MLDRKTSTTSDASPVDLRFPPIDRAVGIRSLMALVRRRAILSASVALVIAGLCALGIFAANPVYSSSSSILIEVQPQSVSSAVQVTGAPPEVGYIETAAEVVRSRSAARSIVDRLDLASWQEFDPKPGWLSLQLFGEPTPLTETLRMEAVVDRVLHNLKAERVGNTRIVTITFRSKRPETAAEVANAFADEYLVTSLKTRINAVRVRTEWLNTRLAQLRSEVREADEAVASYKARNGLVGFGDSSGTVTDRQVNGITAQLSAAEAQLAAAEAELGAARNQAQVGGVVAIPGVLTSRVVADLRRQRTEVERQTAEYAARLGPNHPDFVRSQQQLNRIDQQIHDESRRIVAGLEASAQSARARVDALREQQANVEARFAGDTEAAVQLASLKREADAKRDIYNQVASAAQLLGQQSALDQPDGRVVSLAPIPSRPIFPNKPLFLAIGVLVGALAGIGVAFLAEALRSRFLSAEDVERGTGLPCLASVPRLSRRVLRRAGKGVQPETYASAKPLSAFAEAFRNVRSAIYSTRADFPAKVVAVTSAMPGEGKSVAAASLAEVLATGGCKVALVDCDLRRRSLSRIFGANEAGLTEILDGTASLQEAARRRGERKLVFVPAGRNSGVTLAGTLLSPAMAEFLRTLCASHDHVVLDLPPVLAAAEARSLAARADAVVFAVRWSRTGRSPAGLALERLQRDGAPVSGVLLSMVDERARRSIGEGDDIFYQPALRRYYEN